MKRLLMIGCLVMAACAGTGRGKIDEKTQEELDAKAISTSVEIATLQKKAQVESSKLQRQFDEYKKGLLVKLGYNPNNYQLAVCGHRWIVLDNKTGAEVK